VGNPFRLQSTVTAGIVSAKARNIQILNNQNYSIESFIQTDAAVNPGNSGGALVNTTGELVGINTAIMTYSGSYEGYSFSIPSNLVKKVVMDLKEFGVVQRGLLGVVIENMTNESAKEKSLNKVTGARITAINQGGAAQEGGLQVEDVILEVNGRAINSVPELQEIIGRFRPGQQVSITYWRNKIKNYTKLTLRNQVNTTELISTRKDKVLTDLGFELRELTEMEKAKVGSFGIRVISIYENSTIALTNMAPNFIITSINKKPVNNIDQLIAIINETKGKITLEGIYEKYRGRYPYSFYREE
jgi:serine protease Do